MLEHISRYILSLLFRPAFSNQHFQKSLYDLHECVVIKRTQFKGATCGCAILIGYSSTNSLSPRAKPCARLFFAVSTTDAISLQIEMLVLLNRIYSSSVPLYKYTFLQKFLVQLPQIPVSYLTLRANQALHCGIVSK